MPLTRKPLTMSTPTPQLDDLKRQITQLDELIAQGVLSGEPARQARDKLEQQVLALVLQGTGASAAAPVAAPPNAPPVAPDALVPASVDNPESAEIVMARPSRNLLAALVVFVMVFGVAGYLWRGNLDAMHVAPGESGEAVAAAKGGAGGGDHTTNQAQFEAMVQKLADRLKSEPDNAEGFAMLGRSYTALGKLQEALAAYQQVVKLKPNDAQALADLADGLATANGRNLQGEPAKLIAQALKIDPKNVKALSLAGTIAFNQADYKQAVAVWERAAQVIDPASEFAQQLQGGIAEARQRAGMPSAPAAAAPSLAQLSGASSAPAADSKETAPATAPGASVSGQVKLGAALKGKVSPDDTLFIFARPATGSKMPLAILRKRVADLPVTFVLDDSLAMSPAARISGVPKVVVGARISKSGQAVPQAGDYQVFSAEVPVGAKDLVLEIAEAVK